jgi:ATPase subunit of ABC transporter with duplicated ATPase domains
LTLKGAINALSKALQSFTGGVLVISHDQHFIQSLCNEIWHFTTTEGKNTSVDGPADNGNGNGNGSGSGSYNTIKIFDGDFAKYKKLTINELTKKSNAAKAARGGAK